MTASRDEVLEAAAEEYFQARERGEPIDRDAFLLRYADIADELAAFFFCDDLLDGMIPLAPLARRETRTDSEPTLGWVETAAADHFAGEPFGRYQLLAKVGQGGMGAVYKAYDTQLHRLVALKIPRIDPADVAGLARFHQEARTAATLSHPNLCPVYDVGEYDRRHYLTMLYIPGRTLADLIEEASATGKQLAQRHVALLVRKLARALAYAHASGVVHRDLKPANVMIVRDGRVSEPLITDFGLARRTTEGGERLTQSLQLMGTPAYMSPEQASGRARDAGEAGDVYCLGMILYELLTGRFPYDFTGLTLPGILRVIADDPPTPPSQYRSGVDKTFESICLKALAKRPEGRFRSMTEFEAALTDYVEGTKGTECSTAADWDNRAVEIVAELAAERPADVTTPRSDLGRRKRLWFWGAVASIMAVSVIVYQATNIGYVSVKVAETTSPVEITIGGRPVDRAALEAPLPLRVGSHELTAAAKGYEPLAYSFAVRRGAFETIMVALNPIAASTPTRAPPIHVAEQPETFAFLEQNAFDGLRLPLGWGADFGTNSGYDLKDRRGLLRLSAAPNGQQLLPPGTPRVVRKATGDFRLETVVESDPRHDFQGAGILVWDGTGRFLRVYRAFGGPDAGLASGIRFDRQDQQKVQPIRSSVDHRPTASRVHLRLVRTGRRFTAAWKSESQEWKALGSVEVDYPQELHIGLGLSVVKAPPFYADFDFVRLWQGNLSREALETMKTSRKDAARDQPEGGREESASLCETKLVGRAAGEPFFDEPAWLTAAGPLMTGLMVFEGTVDGAPGIVALQPLYGQDASGAVHGTPTDPHRHRLAAESGYAVGGLLVKADSAVRSLCVVFFRIKDHALDPADYKYSDWINEAALTVAAETVGCNGYPVVGVQGRCGPAIHAIGLLQRYKD